MEITKTPEWLAYYSCDFIYIANNLWTKTKIKDALRRRDKKTDLAY